MATMFPEELLIPRGLTYVRTKISAQVASRLNLLFRALFYLEPFYPDFEVTMCDYVLSKIFIQSKIVHIFIQIYKMLQFFSFLTKESHILLLYSTAMILCMTASLLFFTADRIFIQCECICVWVGDICFLIVAQHAFNDVCLDCKRLCLFVKRVEDDTSKIRAKTVDN